MIDTENYEFRHLVYNGYMNSDLGFLDLDDGLYDLVNGNIPDHLCEISAHIVTYGEEYTFINKFAKLVKLYRDKLIEQYPDEKEIWDGITDDYLKCLEDPRVAILKPLRKHNREAL